MSSAPSIVHLQRLLGSLPIASVVVGVDGLVMAWNPHAAELFGWAESEALGSRLDALIRPAAGELDATELMRQLQRGESWEGEYRVLARDGRELTLHVIDSPVLDDSGTIVAFLGLSMDVTRERSAPRAVLEAVIENSATSVTVVGGDDRIVLTLGDARTSSAEKEAFIGRELGTMVADPAFNEMVARVRRDGNARHVVDFDGRTYDTAAVRVADAVAGEGGIAFVATDITERVAEFRRYQALIENMQEVTSILAADGTVLYISPSVEHLSGYPLAEIPGSAGWDVHPDDKPAAARALEDVLERPGAMVHQSFRAGHRDGRWLDVEQTIVNRLDDPAVMGLVSVARDVTDRQTAERRLLALMRMHEVLSETGNAMVHAVDPMQLLVDTCHILVSTGEFAAAAFTSVADGEHAAQLLTSCAQDGPGDPVGDAAAIEVVTVAEASAARPADSTAPVRYLFRLDRHEDAPGAMLLTTRAGRPGISSEEVALLTGLARDLAFALDSLSVARNRAEAMEMSMRRARQQSIVASLGLMALSMADTGDVIDGAVAALAPFALRQIAVYELMADGSELLVRGVSGETASVARGQVLERRVVALADQVLSRGEPLTVDDLDSAPQFGLDVSASGGGGSAVSVPIRVGDEVVAVLAVHSAQRADFDLHDVHFLESVAHVISGAIERSRHERAIRHDAMHDRLTGLPNRTLLQDRLSQALYRWRRGQGGALAVLVADLDGFKRVNDTLGHAAGDRLLALVASRLREAVRPSDTVARLGGDQFVILCDDLADAAEGTTVARRVIERLGESFVVDGREVLLTVSIGIAAASDDTTVEGLLRDADVAMYRAKETGRGRYELVDESLRRRLLHRMEIERDLTQALDRGQFVVAYQPVIELTTGDVHEAEALLRWVRDDGMPISPAEFIPIAEQTGQIVDIGAWVLLQACRDAVRWNAELPQAAPVSVAVNLSARQIADPDLVSTVERALASTGLDPALLRLEITETSLMGEGGAAAATLQALDLLGIRLSVDDFGTGYSSLMYLRRYPVRVLKVDRYFVAGLGKNPEDEAIVDAVIALAHSLGLSATAEGVETIEQLRHLRNLRCDSAQGFLWSKAVAFEQFVDLVETLRGAVDEPTNHPSAILPALAIASVPGAGRSAPQPPAALASSERCRVVLADDSASDRGLLRIALEESGRFTVVGEAADGEAAVAVARETQPDLLVLDMSMPGMNGLEALGPIQGASPATLVVVLSGFLSGALAEAASVAGAYAQYDKSLPLDVLLRRLTAVHQESRAGAAGTTPAAEGAGTTIAERLPTNLASLVTRAAAPDGLLPLVQGTRALLRATTVEEVVETCCLVVRRLGGSIVTARLAGADALPMDLSFGHGEPLLAAATGAVRTRLETVLPDLLEDARAAVASVRRTGMLASEATVDGLTGLLNRRSIDRILARINVGDVVMLLDLDHFKEVNDQLGHATGDLVLTAFARVMRQQGRASDRLGRLGGDEFIAILQAGDTAAAEALLERLRTSWEAVRPQPVSFSVGIAVATGGDAAEVLSRADAALYGDKAKKRAQALALANGAA